MPSPRLTSLADIVGAGRRVLARDGLDGLTMATVAAEVGVRPPSLYKHVRDRTDLVAQVKANVADDVGRVLASSGTGADTATALRSMADALRVFAHRDPHSFTLLFSGASDPALDDRGLLAHAAAPVLAVAEAMAGPAHALSAARTITAWTSGFLLMELAEAFRLGGDVDEAFAYGVDALHRALSSRDR